MLPLAGERSIPSDAAKLYDYIYRAPLAGRAVQLLRNDPALGVPSREACRLDKSYLTSCAASSLWLSQSMSSRCFCLQPLLRLKQPLSASSGPASPACVFRSKLYARKLSVQACRQPIDNISVHIARPNRCSFGERAALGSAPTSRGT